MSTIASPTYDQILNAMETGLAPIKAPSSGVTPTQYMRFVQRYMGEHFDAEQFGDRGGAGRTPGAYVAFAGEKPIRGTISRRRQRVEAAFAVVVVSDSRRSRDDRKAVFGPIHDVRGLLGGRTLSLAMTPLAYQGITQVADNDTVFAYAVRFTTRYVADYTINPGTDLLLGADGQIVYPPTGAPAAPPAPSIVLIGTAGTAHYAYDVKALYAPGVESNFSAWTDTETAPNTLNAANKLQVTWTAQPGATGYVLRRRWTTAGGPAAGVIYTGTATTFIDDGSVAGTGGTLPVRGLNYHGVF